MPPLAAVGGCVLGLVQRRDHGAGRVDELRLLAGLGVKGGPVDLVVLLVRLVDLASQLNCRVVVSTRALDKGWVELISEDAVGAALVKCGTEALHLLDELLLAKGAQAADQTADGAHEPHVHGHRLEVSIQIRVEAEANLGPEDRGAQHHLVGQLALRREAGRAQLGDSERGHQEPTQHVRPHLRKQVVGQREVALHGLRVFALADLRELALLAECVVLTHGEVQVVLDVQALRRNRHGHAEEHLRIDVGAQLGVLDGSHGQRLGDRLVVPLQRVAAGADGGQRLGRNQLG